ncbi:hypothetical protein AAHE18_12G136800 [Arachis hypogaea]
MPLSKPCKRGSCLHMSPSSSPRRRGGARAGGRSRRRSCSVVAAVREPDTAPLEAPVATEDSITVRSIALTLRGFEGGEEAASRRRRWVLVPRHRRSCSQPRLSLSL